MNISFVFLILNMELNFIKQAETVSYVNNAVSALDGIFSIIWCVTGSDLKFHT